MSVPALRRMCFTNFFMPLLSQYLFTGDYNKPLFTVYFKTTLFSIYLVAFVFWRPWQRLCCKCGNSRWNRRCTQCSSNTDTDSQVKLSCLSFPKS